MEPNKVMGDMGLFATIRRAFSYETDAMPTRGVEPPPFQISYTPQEISDLLDAGAAKSEQD